MLRITARAGARHCTVLKLEGAVAADWVRVVENECRTLLGGGERVVLDLADVAYVDSDGAAMLRALAAERVRRVNVPEHVEAFVRHAGRA